MSLFASVSLPGHPDPENIRCLDLLPVPQIRRMMRMGIAIDPEHFRELSSQLESTKAELRQEICEYIPPKKLEEFVGEGEQIELNVDSAEQIAKLLFKLLGVGRGQRLRTTKSGKRISTGKKQLEALKYDHPAIPKILEYRECSKLKGTFCDALVKSAMLHPKGACSLCGSSHLDKHWRIHGIINTTCTVAGRLSMKKPNLQQIPVRTKLGKEVRRGFVAGPGKKLVTCDFSQLHLRLAAHFADEESMIRVFKVGGDIHVETARRAFGLKSDEQPDKLTQRDPTKTTNFFILNRGGAPGLFDVLVVNFALADKLRPDWLTIEWCEKFIETWFALYPKVAEWFDVQDYRARRYGIVWCRFGRVRRVPEIRSVHQRVQAAGLRQAGNHPLIGTEAGMFRLAQARVENKFELLRSQGIGVEALVPMHDELVCEVDEEWAEEVLPMIEWEMGRVLRDEESGEEMSRVPILAEGKVVERWEK